MSSEDAPQANLGEEAMDTEHEREEGAEEETPEVQEGQEEEEGPQKTPRASWAGSLIIQIGRASCRERVSSPV